MVIALFSIFNQFFILGFVNMNIIIILQLVLGLKKILRVL
jgi:hypothetical protein